MVISIAVLPCTALLAQKYGKAKQGRAKVTNANNKPAAANGTKTEEAEVSSAAVQSNPIVGYDTTLPKTYDTIIPGQIGVAGGQTLRNNYGVDKGISSAKDRTPLPYEHLRDEDAMYSQFIWREINAKEKINQSFMYNGKDEFNRDQRFISVLIDAIQTDSVQAFETSDDRFTSPMSLSTLLGKMQGQPDTVEVKDINDPDKVVGYSITRKRALIADSIYTFRLKEQWIFDRESSRMFTRIIGIAPVQMNWTASGPVPVPLFWVYYPDLRATLAKYDVYNPKNSYGRMTWEDVFEGRMFNSYVIKSTVDNTNDAYLKSYIKDPLFRLYEGENIKEKIFNYEQNLWQY